MAKKLYIKTFGCQMNVYDSARMADVLAPMNFAPVDSSDEADMVVLNTCHIREKAAEKLYSELGRLSIQKRAHARDGRRMIIAVAGCVAQAEGEEVMRRAPSVDLVFGPQNYHQLPEMVARLEGDVSSVVETEFPLRSKFDFLPEEAQPRAPGRGISSFLTVQEGCDRFCTFCVVPYTRGAEFSRSVAQIEAEAIRLVNAGAREITLLGQNVNAYHGNDDGAEASLASLIERLADIPGLARIRYTTSHPRDMLPDLIAAHGAVEPLMPFLHLPVQSGSDRMLKAMNRRHDAAFYYNIVADLRRARPDIALSSDFIVGYPGETDADFAATMALVENVGYAQAFSFKYSARPGTPAADLEDQVPEPLKAERLAELQERLRRQQNAFNETMVGRVLPVLFERAGRDAGQIIGRSPYLHWVHVTGDEALIGEVRDVRIIEAFPNSLAGQMVDIPVSAQPGGEELRA
jgi:tRNA-2-methylthio-N6-dimethylallyladenosine synthase